MNVNEDFGSTVIDVLPNDGIAPDTGETLTVTAVTQPANGTVTLVGGVVSYTPDPDFFGTDTFTYTISDGNGGTDTATVTVNVANVNDDPDAGRRHGERQRGLRFDRHQRAAQRQHRAGHG